MKSQMIGIAIAVVMTCLLFCIRSLLLTASRNNGIPRRVYLLGSSDDEAGPGRGDYLNDWTSYDSNLLRTVDYLPPPLYEPTRSGSTSASKSSNGHKD